MGELWDKKDICFFFDGLDNNRYPLISNPYVSRSFAPQNLPVSSSGAQPSTNMSPSIINKTLFALGIVLIELCLNRPFEDLRHPNTTPNIIDDYQIAIDAVSEVYMEGGDQYGYVVQRCLRCEFLGQDSRKKLDDNRFRRFVYEGVLEPLKDDYKHFSL